MWSCVTRGSFFPSGISHQSWFRSWDDSLVNCGLWNKSRLAGFPSSFSSPPPGCVCTTSYRKSSTIKPHVTQYMNEVPIRFATGTRLQPQSPSENRSDLWFTITNWKKFTFKIKRLKTWKCNFVEPPTQKRDVKLRQCKILSLTEPFRQEKNYHNPDLCTRITNSSGQQRAASQILSWGYCCFMIKRGKFLLAISICSQNESYGWRESGWGLLTNTSCFSTKS